MAFHTRRARVRVLHKIIAVTIALSVGTPLLALSSQTPAKSVVRGSLRSTSDGRAIEGANVALPELDRSATTNSRGEFSFPDIPAGSWLLSARAIGFASSSRRVVTSRSGVIELELRLEPSAIELSPMNITSSRGRATGGREAISSVSVLDADQIAVTPAGTTDELLRGIPGVQLPLVNSTLNFPVNPSVAIRGAGLGDNGTRTLVLVDGRPANGAFFGNVFWNRMPRQNVDRIEVVRGGAGSSLFGSYAMGGVINILTRPLTEQSSVSAEVKGGNHGLFQADASASTGLGGVRVGVAANFLRTDGYFRVASEERGPIDRRPSADQVSVQVKAETDFSSGWSVGLTGNFYDQDQESDSRLSVTNTQIFDASVRARRQVGSSGFLTASFFAADEDFANDGVSTIPFGTREGEFVSNAHVTPTTDLGGSVVWNAVFAGLFRSASVGVDARYVNGSDDADIFLSNGTLSLNRIGRGKQRVLGAFAEATVSPHSKVEVVGSARIDNFRNFAGENLENGTRTTFASRDFTEFNPRLGVRYQPVDALGIRASAYSAFRAPTLSELYRSFGTATFVGLANPDLKAETLTGVDGGIDLQAGPFSGQINVFYVEIKNQVGGVVTAFNPFTLRNENIGTAESKGVELIGQVALTSRLFLSGGYTYTDAEVTDNDDDPDLIGKRIEGAPRHAFTGSAGYNDPGGIGFTIRVRSLGSQFQDISNETRLGAHTVVDAFASYRLRQDIQFFLEVENLFDENYTATALGGAPRRGAPFQINGGARISYR